MSFDSDSQSIPDEQTKAGIMVLYTVLADDGDSLSWASFRCNSAFTAAAPPQYNPVPQGSPNTPQDSSISDRKRFIPSRLEECREMLYTSLEPPAPIKQPIINIPSTSKTMPTYFTGKAPQNKQYHELNKAKPYFKDKPKSINKSKRSTKSSAKKAETTAATAETSGVSGMLQDHSALFSEDSNPRGTFKDISQFKIFQLLRN